MLPKAPENYYKYLPVYTYSNCKAPKDYSRPHTGNKFYTAHSQNGQALVLTVRQYTQDSATTSTLAYTQLSVCSRVARTSGLAPQAFLPYSTLPGTTILVPIKIVNGSGT